METLVGGGKWERKEVTGERALHAMSWNGELTGKPALSHTAREVVGDGNSN